MVMILELISIQKERCPLVFIIVEHAFETAIHFFFRHMAMYLLAQSYQKIKNNAYLLVEGLHEF